MPSTELWRTWPVAATSSNRSLAASRSSNFTRLCSMRAEPSKRLARISKGRYSVCIASGIYSGSPAWRFLFFRPQLLHPLQEFLFQLRDADLGETGDRYHLDLGVALLEFLQVL